MLTLPPPMVAALAAFVPAFSPRVWRHAQALLAGALLAPAQRTVAAALRVMGLARAAQFHRYHRVLSRARWSGLALSRLLLQLLVAAFAPHGPLLVGIDETVERRERSDQQLQQEATEGQARPPGAAEDAVVAVELGGARQPHHPVSYTHLTLPTKA